MVYAAAQGRSGRRTAFSNLDADGGRFLFTTDGW